MKPIRIYFVDGSAAEITADGAWDLCLPRGRHVRGTAPNLEAARQVVDGEHDKYILECWSEGTIVSVPAKAKHARVPHFLVPLS